MRLIPLIALALALTACGNDKPEAPIAPGESKVAAKAVADVDGAMADAPEQAMSTAQTPTN